jgi:hypothetical protein
MLLRDLWPQFRISSIAELHRRLELTKLYAWLLWHGKIGVSSYMLRRLHGELGIPLNEPGQVEWADPAKRRGRKPRRSYLQGCLSTWPEEAP